MKLKFKKHLEDYQHAKNDLYKIVKYSEDLMGMISPCEELEDWVKAKLTHAEDYLNTVLDYIKYYKFEGKIPNKMAIGDLKSIQDKALQIFKHIDSVPGLRDWVKSKINLAGEYLDDVYHHLDYKNLDIKAPSLKENRISSSEVNNILNQIRMSEKDVLSLLNKEGSNFRDPSNLPKVVKSVVEKIANNYNGFQADLNKDKISDMVNHLWKNRTNVQHSVGSQADDMPMIGGQIKSRDF